jgi:hypothetical protein
VQVVERIAHDPARMRSSWPTISSRLFGQIENLCGFSRALKGAWAIDVV